MKEIIIANGFIVQVTDCDHFYLCGYKWRKTPKGYIITDIRKNKKNTTIYMHRLVAKLMGLNPNSDIDHKDRNRFNNQRNNLREATQTQNNGNMSLRKDNLVKLKGVSKTKVNRYMSRIRIHNNVIYLGTYNTPEEAHEAYKIASEKYFGEFSCEG